MRLMVIACSLLVSAGCTGMMQRAAVRFAGTPETAARALFSSTPAETAILLAGWCSEPRRLRNTGWNVDEQSDESVACSREYKTNDGSNVNEWVTWTLTAVPEGTRVIGEPTVRMTSSPSDGAVGIRISSGEPVRGSFTDLQVMLEGLGGVAP